MLKNILISIVTAIFSVMLGLLLGANSMRGTFQEKLNNMHESINATRESVISMQSDVKNVIKTTDRHDEEIRIVEDRLDRMNDKITLAVPE